MKVLIILSRWLVGAVFIFSGLVKGVDPLGTAYRIEDYFQAYGAAATDGVYLVLSICLSMAEFLLGIALLMNLLPRITAWLVLMLLLFFTGVTFIDALYEPVPDCGCFGDALKLTNWETLFKNLVLMVFALLIFTGRKAQNSWFSIQASWIMILTAAMLFTTFSIFNYYYLPIWDFRAWKEGSQIQIYPEGKVDVFVIYQNKNTGETQEYLSPDYPWRDSAWSADWEFVDQREVYPEGMATHEIFIEDEAGTDRTADVLYFPGKTWLFVSYDLDMLSVSDFRAMEGFHKYALENDMEAALLTSSLYGKIKAYRQQYPLLPEAYLVDDITLKAMIRSNPGLILIENGKVLRKWPRTCFRRLMSDKEIAIE